MWVCIPMEEVCHLFFFLIIDPTWQCRFVCSVIQCLVSAGFYRPGAQRSYLEISVSKDLEIWGPLGFWSAFWWGRFVLENGDPQVSGKLSLDIVFPAARKKIFLCLFKYVWATQKSSKNHFQTLLLVFPQLPEQSISLFNYCDDND